MGKKYYRTDQLFARGSLLIGAGSLLGIFSPYFTFNYSNSDREADSRAIESDFGVVGKDIRSVLNSFSL